MRRRQNSFFLFFRSALVVPTSLSMFFLQKKDIGPSFWMEDGTRIALVFSVAAGQLIGFHVLLRSLCESCIAGSGYCLVGLC